MLSRQHRPSRSTARARAPLLRLARKGGDQRGVGVPQVDPTGPAHDQGDERARDCPGDEGGGRLFARAVLRHSLRAGFLTDAGRQNANLFKSKEHSRHASLQMVAEYMRDHERFREHADEGFCEAAPTSAGGRYGSALYTCPSTSAPPWPRSMRTPCGSLSKRRSRAPCRVRCTACGLRAAAPMSPNACGGSSAIWPSMPRRDPRISGTTPARAMNAGSDPVWAVREMQSRMAEEGQERERFRIGDLIPLDAAREWALFGRLRPRPRAPRRR